MTYAILKEGVFHLFEILEEQTFCESPICKLHCKCALESKLLIKSASESAIVAEDQDMVKQLLTKKCECHCHTTGAFHFMPCCFQGFIYPQHGIFYPLPGYRIEVIDLCHCARHPGMFCFSGKFKTAKLIKE